jgi:hypothetical protein
VERDVDCSRVDRDARPLGDEPTESISDRDATRVDTDEREVTEVRVTLDQLVRDPREGTREGCVVE